MGKESACHKYVLYACDAVPKADGKHRALLLTKEKTVPLLWKVLGSKYHGRLRLAVVKNEKGDIPRELGIAEDAKVVLYLAGGSSKPIVYEGLFLFPLDGRDVNIPSRPHQV